ncbi:MAG: putative N-acetylglucosaminyltransferase [Acidimicrobiales bacterium]|nr:putative N-acetylglucosaminyltransferase [Acidimicrobiales bacterium]
MIFDCFTFSTELDLLHLRLQLLSSVVDRFVIVEAPRTFSGVQKPLFFQENRERFKQFLDSIVHVVVDDLPMPVPDRWQCEYFQRNAISRGLDDCSTDDLVIVGDVDEFPDPAVLRKLAGVDFQTAVLELRASFYRANWEANIPWPHTRVARAGSLGSPQSLRDSQPLFRFADAGAHLSYLMSPVEIARKYQSFSHAELDTVRARRSNFLRSMQGLRIYAPNLELLSVRQPEELGWVQRWILAREPRYFDFAPAPSVLRRVGRKWATGRRRSALSENLVSVGDAVLASAVAARGLLQRSAVKRILGNEGFCDPRGMTMGSCASIAGEALVYSGEHSAQRRQVDAVSSAIRGDDDA